VEIADRQQIPRLSAEQLGDGDPYRRGPREEQHGHDEG
jgi:hypothetical protein